MPDARGQRDQSTDGALRPTTVNATSLPSSHLRSQNSQASLRSGAGSAASMRSRQNRDLFAPSLSRRAPSRNLRHQGDVVLVDSDSDRDREIVSTSAKHRGLRRTRRLSGDFKTKARLEDEIFNRQADGSFIRTIPGLDEAIQKHLESPELVEEATLRSNNDEYAAIALQYFTSGASLGNAERKQHAEGHLQSDCKMASHWSTRTKIRYLQHIDQMNRKAEITQHADGTCYAICTLPASCKSFLPSSHSSILTRLEYHPTSSNQLNHYSSAIGSHSREDELRRTRCGACWRVR
ncbi:hypothetical protein MRB53_037967 [Persea americana]|nr:hypothetical protein MRB53_037967 [Persea americana]